jgi:Protein kinase domain
VHRDVKPGNMLIERGDEGDPDHVYLADFGITKHAMSRTGLTSTGQFLGTIDYVAPEQIRGTSVTGLADQYSLGCVLYECLTGRVPFEKDLDAAIIWAHVEETPVMPTVLRPELPPEVDEVFGRVLAKRPDERYGSCREFIDAARTALGIPGTSPQSSPAHVPAAINPSTATPPGGRAGALPDRYSGSSPASHAYAPDPAAVPAPGFTGPGQPRGGQPNAGPSGYGQHAGPPPAGRPSAGQREPRWYRRPRWIAVLGVVVLVLAVLGTWAGLNGARSHHGATMPSMSPKPKPTISALMAALALANKSPDAKGQLPPSTCKQDNRDKVTCTAPVAGITGVVFQTYPNLKTMYAAYTAKVSSLTSNHQFRQNFADCESQATYGEAGWNHQFQHTDKYTVDQMTTGTITDDQAAGRVFCTYSQGLEYMAWTQDDGHLMGYVAGPIHTDVWNWWVAVHHNIGIGGAAMNMEMPGSSPSVSSSASPSMSGMGG